MFETYRFKAQVIDEMGKHLPGIIQHQVFMDCENFSPKQYGPVIRKSADGLEAVSMRWGFKSAWKDRPLLTHAEAETVHEKKAFMNAFLTRRCLIPASGFYINPSKLLSHPDDAPMVFAGIWDTFQTTGERESKTVDMFSILTTVPPANLKAQIHSQLPTQTSGYQFPLILAPEDWLTWLNDGHQFGVLKGFLQDMHNI